MDAGRYPADKRGELQSAVNLQDCFGGIIAVAAIEGMIRLAELLGMSDLAGFRMQMAVVGVSCGLMSWFIIRILPADFIRLVCLAAVKTLYRIKFSGTERIPKTGGVLLLPNHVTFADAFFISAVTDRTVRFVMDETFMKRGIIRFAVRLFGAVPIRRDQPLEAIRKTIAALEEGHVVALFPEGQLTRTGSLCELERGFELIARKVRSPILPVWVDGSWGSIFSFERGRFFTKFPRRIPYGLSIAVGEEITGRPDRELVRAALMRTSAQAVARRFAKGGTPARIDGYRMTQLDALPRGAELRMLQGDLPGLNSFEEFARQTKGRVVRYSAYDPAAGGIWIGGENLREAMKNAEPHSIDVTFFDFSGDALENIGSDRITHLPCLATDDQVISMSMPHPQNGGEDSLFQHGHKPRSWGKILPGLYVENGRVFPGNSTLPSGAELDGEGFVMDGR